MARSGGFAGLRREWRVSGATDTDVDWAALVDDCPWPTGGRGLPTQAPQARDQFTWTIDAREGNRSRHAAVPESALTPAWRRLIDQVKKSA